MITDQDPVFLQWAGVDQGTMASLVANGLHYECLVWLNKADCRVEAMCKVTLPDASKALVFHNWIDTASATVIDDTGGYPFDCPRIIAVGTTFVVHWLASTDFVPVGEDDVHNWQLFRATMDMTAFDASVGGWDNRGALGVFIPYALYDVAPLSDTDFLLARSITDGETIRVERYDGFDIIDTDWQTDLDVPHEGRVLGLYGHEDDGDVLVTYERTGEGETEGGSLWTWRLDVVTGTEEASDVQTFVTYSQSEPHGPFANAPTLTLPGAHYVNAKHRRVASGIVAVVAESVLFDIVAAGKPLSYVHHLSWRALVSGDATRLGDYEGWVPHLSMVSEPFAYANGTNSAGTQPNLYVIVSYKSIYLTNDWEQATIFCVDLNYPRWGSQDAGQQLRPRPIATLSSVGIPDARVSGWHPEAEGAVLTDPVPLNGPAKRVNHVTSLAAPAPYGPDMKAVTAAVGIWAQMGNVGTPDNTGNVVVVDNAPVVSGGEKQPEILGYSGWSIHLEEPWTLFRDDSAPTQPVDNFVGAYPRAACQSIEVGRGLAIFGGTPYLYDGERTGEIGFPWGPEVIQAAGGESGDGDLTADGVYLYYVVATRRDKQGQVHRSRPSRIATVTLAGAENAVQLRIRTQTLSLWDHGVYYPSAPAMQFEVFRTEANGSIFYRLFGARQRTGVQMRPQETPTNNPLAILGYIDVEDELSDVELARQGLAPFTLGPGGFIELTPQTVPAMHCPVVWQNRLWGADSLDRSLLWYSDEILPEFASDYYRAPEFNDANTFRIDGLGEVTALQPYGNDLIVFTSTATYAVTGDCNDGTGQGATLVVQLIDAGTGCIDPKSVVLAPTGVFFQSHKGYYYLAGRSLDYLSAGASIEDDIREAGNVRGACMKENSTQLLVACNGRPVTTYTTTWEVSQVPETPGSTYSITLTGVGAPGLICETENDISDSDTDIATRLVAQIAAMLADRSTGLHLYIASVSVVGDDVRVVWQPDVVPSYTDTPNAPGNSLVGTDTSSLAVQPRVLALDYLQKRWSRWELIDVSSTERLNEVVGSANWRGAEGFQCHAVLHQGGLHLQRSPRDANAYADQTSVGAEVAVRLDIKTSPIHFAGIGGWQRLRRLYIQATKHNASQFNVDLDYFTSGNYEVPDDVDEDITVTTTTPAGLEVCPRRQKLQAIAIRIHEPVGVTDLQNVTIHSITLLAGLKKGTAKHRDAQRGVA